MTVRDIPTEGNEGKISRTVNFDAFSRTLIAAAQMAGDGLILTILSYVSLRFVIYPYGSDHNFLLRFDCRHHYNRDRFLLAYRGL
jgi:hypothetical protein